MDRYDAEMENKFEEDDYPTKVCPRCGAVLFADMDICFGCLYDFSRVPQAPSLPGSAPLTEMPMAPAPEEPPASPPEIPPAAAAAPSPPPSPDDTALQQQDQTMKLFGREEPDATLAVRVSLPDLSVVLPVPKRGLVLGREETNDIVLRQRTVSRHHMRLYPTQDGAACEDLGATNPALIAGTELEGMREVPIGTQIDVCGARLTLIRNTDAA